MFNLNSKLYYEPKRKTLEMARKNNQFKLSTSNKTALFGVILGYPQSFEYELESMPNDLILWKKLCEANGVAAKIVCDSNKEKLITINYVAKKINQLFKYSLENLSDLSIILISGHGSLNSDGDFMYLMYNENGELEWVNMTQQFTKIFQTNANLIDIAKLNTLILVDTCYSANILKLPFELTQTNLPMSRKNFYQYIFDNMDIDWKTYRIWVIGASKKLTSIQCEVDDYVSEFTSKLFKVNVLSDVTITQSLLRLKSIFSECSIFFSQIYD